MQSLLLLLLLLLAADAGTYRPFLDCATAPFTCGNLTINVSYPFRLSNRHDYCGSPGFLLTCTDHNSTLTINIGDDGYQVKAVDYLNHLLTVVDTNLTARPCPRPYKNITVDLAALYWSTDRYQTLTVFIDCNASSKIPAQQAFGIDCLSGSYFVVGNRNLPGLSENCNSTVVVPVNPTAAERMAIGALGFREGLQEGFTLGWMPGKGWCQDCVNSGGICGYNDSAPDDRTCHCPYGLELGACSSAGAEGHGRAVLKIVIGVIAGISSLILGFIFLFLYIWRDKKFHNHIRLGNKKSNIARRIESLLEKYGSLAPKRYNYSDVKKMTKSFSNKLGQGGYGVVYKGELHDGHPVAVKVLSSSTSNGEDFVNEVASIGKTSHVNVVSLLGFCYEGSKRALIFDFMPNGSLEKFICAERSETTPLGWENLLKIAVGIARGLEYLHRGCNTRIVHFDIKPHNILLDQDFCPKISDFGLAKLCRPKESIISMCGARGTAGYIAPEVFSRNFGVVSSKSDVYSYGMMLLEMVGVKRIINAEARNTSETYFPHWIYEHLDQDGDLSVCGVTGETKDIALKMILVGLWCIQTNPQNRPSISRVLEMFEGSISGLQMPPKPYLFSPVRSFTSSSTVMIEECNSKLA